MRALVLSGGGAKGAYQVGVLKRWMGEQGADYDIICGISVGALNGTFLAQQPRDPVAAVTALETLWLGLTDSKVKKRRWWGYLAPVFGDSLYDTTPLRQLVERAIDPQALQAHGRKLRIGAVSLDTGAYFAADEHTPELAAWVMASSAFPLMFPPVKLRGERWTDGGVRNVTPLGDAIKAGATSIDVIMCGNPDLPHRWPSEGQAAIPGLAMRTLELLTDEVMRNDLQVAGLKNELAPQGGSLRKVPIRLMQPTVPLDHDSLDFSPGPIRAMLAQGYADAAPAA